MVLFYNCSIVFDDLQIESVSSVNVGDRAISKVKSPIIVFEYSGYSATYQAQFITRYEEAQKSLIQRKHSIGCTIMHIIEQIL
jgi:hypothetical protein